MKCSNLHDEVFEYATSVDKLSQFVEMLKSCGCYISEDGHIRNKKGCLMSKLTSDGYWLTMAQYEKKCYCFYEHYVIWVWHNGDVPCGKVVKHIDHNRSNNIIDNLELEDHYNYKVSPFGNSFDESPITVLQANTIRKLGHICSWNAGQVASLIGYQKVLYGATKINDECYPNITPGEIMDVFPILVDYTRNKDVSPVDELKDYALGLAGETGEVCDLIKKKLYHGKDVSPVDILLELGDVLYYLCAICNVLGIDFYEVFLNNNAKLIARYPKGFSPKDSENRIEDKCCGYNNSERGKEDIENFKQLFK